MPIDYAMERSAGFRIIELNRWNKDGHLVVLIRRIDVESRGLATTCDVACECDYNVEDLIVDDNVVGVTHPQDPHDCPAKKAVRDEIVAEHSVAMRKVLSEKGLSDAILHAYAQVTSGTYMGQAYSGMIYVQEVAELLGLPEDDVLVAVRTLFAEEKLDLNGMILAPYVKRFRLPKELQHMIRVMVETPIGWPNGEAGDVAICAMEEAIGEHTDFKNGRDAFWEHNYPNIAPNHLLEFALQFLSLTLQRGETEDAARRDLRFTDCERVAVSLEASAVRLRALGVKYGFPKDLIAELRAGKNAEKKTKE